MSKEEKKSVSTKGELVSIKPLKDFEIVFNEFHYVIKKGEELEVHKMFIQNLKTEKVIK